MSERTTPFTLDQVGTGAVRFPSGKPMISSSDTSVNPYAFSQISKDIQVEGVMFWPQTKEKFPGIVLLHENWGLTEQVKNYGNRLACEGYVVIMPNLYGRQGGMVTANREVAEALEQRVIDKDVLQDINSCCEYLNTQDHVKRNIHGVLGFGMSASLAVQFACQRRRLKGAVAYYGKMGFPMETLSNLLCPLLYIQAGNDSTVTPEEAERLQQAGKAFDKSIEIKKFEDVRHAFCNETQKESYDANAAARAWELTLDFFSDRFKGL